MSKLNEKVAVEVCSDDLIEPLTRHGAVTSSRRTRQIYYPNYRTVYVFRSGTYSEEG